MNDGQGIEKLDGISIYPADTGSLEADPRSIVTAVFSVRNTGTEVRKISPEAQVPEGWRLTSPIFPVDLSPGESDIILVSMLVPAQTLADRYLVFCSVEGAKSDASVVVDVRETFGLDLKHVRSPGNVLAGQEYESLFTVSNLGNSMARVNLTIESGKDLEYRLDFDKLVMDPGESRDITIRVPTPEDLPRAMKHYLKLKAGIDGNDEIAMETKSIVEIIPISPAGKIWHSYPLHLAWNGNYSDGEDPFSNSLSMSGRGSLDDRGRHNISFHISPPSFPGSEEDPDGFQWSAGYWNRILRLEAGEKTFSASPLTSGSRNGVGVEGSLSLGDLQIEGFYSPEDRGDNTSGINNDSGTIEDDDGFIGGSLKWKFGDVNSVGIHYFLEDDGFGGRKGCRDGLVGLSGFLRPYDSANIRFETAIETDRPDRFAYTLVLQELKECLDYGFQIRHGSQDFAGNLEDTDYFSGKASVELMEGLKFNAGYSFEKHNLEMDPAESTALSTENTDLGLAWKASPGFEISTSLSRKRQRDLFSDPDYNIREDTTNLSLKRTWEMVRLEVSGDFHRRRDFRNSMIRFYELYNLSADFKPARNITINNNLSYNTGASEPGIMDASVGFGMNCNYSIKDRTYLNAGYKMSRYPSSDYSGYDSLSFGLTHSVGEEGKFGLKGSYNRSLDPMAEGEFSLSLSYTQGVRVPVSRKTDVGGLSGFVFNRETGKGIPDVLVSTGSLTTITDGQGMFRFPAVKEGNTLVQLNTTRIDEGLIVLRDTPIEVEVKTREYVHVEVPMSRPVSISGRLMQYTEDLSTGGLPGEGKDRKVKPDRGISRVLMEVSGEGGARRAFTGPDGSFSFHGLVPGEWTLKVVDTNISPSHYLENEEYLFELEPGQSEKVEIKLFPIIRTIKLLNEGEVLELE